MAGKLNLYAGDDYAFDPRRAHAVGENTLLIDWNIGTDGATSYGFSPSYGNRPQPSHVGPDNSEFFTLLRVTGAGGGLIDVGTNLNAPINGVLTCRFQCIPAGIDEVCTWDATPELYRLSGHEPCHSGGTAVRQNIGSFVGGMGRTLPLILTFGGSLT